MHLPQHLDHPPWSAEELLRSTYLSYPQCTGSGVAFFSMWWSCFNLPLLIYDVCQVAYCYASGIDICWSCYYLSELRVSDFCFRYWGGLDIMCMQIAGTCSTHWWRPSPAVWIKMNCPTWTRSWSGEFMQLPAQQTSSQWTLKILIFSDQQATWTRMWTGAVQKLMKLIDTCLATTEMGTQTQKSDT